MEEMREKCKLLGEWQKASAVKQGEYAQRLGIFPQTLSDITLGRVGITEAEYQRLLKTLQEMVAEMTRPLFEAVCAA